MRSSRHQPADGGETLEVHLLTRQQRIPFEVGYHPLEEMVSFFGCGAVYVNRRHDNHREDLNRYCVTRFSDLRDVIVPFFEANPLRTAKRDNFAKFARIIRLMDRRWHLTVSGLIEIAEIAQTMNLRKPSEVLRILRDHTPTLFPASGEEDDMARTLRRRREVSGNTNPPT